MPVAGAVAIDDLPPPIVEAPSGAQLLIIDLGVAGDVDPVRLVKVNRYAESRRRAARTRQPVGVALVGELGLLASPQHVVWLRPDAVWPRWPGPAHAEGVMAALRERVDRRGELKHYLRLCRELKVGACRITLDGSAFLWADDEAAAILGYDGRADLLRSGRSPLDFHLDRRKHAELVAALDGSTPASIRFDLIRRDGTRTHARIAAILEAPDQILGFLHDFDDLVGEEDRLALERLSDLLDQLGYAYFATALDGRQLATSQKDLELLDFPPAELVKDRSRACWWASERDFDGLLARVRAEGKVMDAPALLRTHSGRHLWVDADCRLIRDGAGEPRYVEGIYRDATARRFSERMARALSMVGASDEGLNPTAQTICEWAADLFEAPACAIVLRDADHRRVFPSFFWAAATPGEERPGGGGEIVLDEGAHAWLAELPLRGVHREPGEQVRDVLAPLFGALAGAMHALCVLPLPDSSLAPFDPAAPVQGYLWIPLTRPPPFSESRFDAELRAFAHLCARQLHLAAGRDAFDLVHELFVERRSITGLSELDTSLGAAREALQARLPMEGCSILRTGIEERRATLELVATSGVEGGEERVSSELGVGLSGRTAAGRGARLSFDAGHEPEQCGEPMERTGHRGQTWMGIPMLDRKGRSIGIIRCVNRVIDLGAPTVTGFSALDRRVAEELAHACALLTELSLMQERERRQMARVTHEIRTPTVGIRNNVRFLKQYRSQRPQPEHKIAAKLDDIELDAQILFNLLQQVEMARGRGNVRVREPRVRTSVRDIVQKTLHQLLPELTARGFGREAVLVDLRRVPPLWLPRAAVAQIVFNLFTNAIKYSRADPHLFRLEIRAESTATAHRVHFLDWGIGVQEEYKDRIFEEEFRTPEARRHDARGLGLGLKISAQLARECGAELTIASLRDPTEFVFVLPRTLGREP